MKKLLIVLCSFISIQVNALTLEYKCFPDGKEYYLSVTQRIDESGKNSLTQDGKQLFDMKTNFSPAWGQLEEEFRGRWYTSFKETKAGWRMDTFSGIHYSLIYSVSNKTITYLTYNNDETGGLNWLGTKTALTNCFSDK